MLAHINELKRKKSDLEQALHLTLNERDEYKVAMESWRREAREAKAERDALKQQVERMRRLLVKASVHVPDELDEEMAEAI